MRFLVPPCGPSAGNGTARRMGIRFQGPATISAQLSQVGTGAAADSKTEKFGHRPNLSKGAICDVGVAVGRG